MSGISSWLQRQKKGDLIELSDSIGFEGYEGLRKVEIDAALQEYLEENAARLSSDPRLAPFYSRRGPGSPIKRESSTALDNGDSTVLRRAAGRPSRRSTFRAVETLVADAAASSVSQSIDDSEEEGSTDSAPEIMTTRTRSAAARTPARNNQISILQNASAVPLPPSPAVIANQIERQTSLIRNTLATKIQDLGIIEGCEAMRENLSNVTAVHIAIFAFEAWALRNELLSNIEAFTIPAITANFLPNWAHLSATTIHLPNFFLLASSTFWYPTILWATTTFVLPLIASYFFNLSLNNSGAPGTASVRYRNGAMGRNVVTQRPVFDPVGYSLDPLTFNIVKALLVYAVFGREWTFGGWVHEESVARINGALYGGWPSVLVGNGIGVLVTLYDALLKK